MTQVRLSYAYGTSSQPLLGMTIGEKFDQACEQYAERDAVVSLHQLRCNFSQNFLIVRRLKLRCNHQSLTGDLV